MAISFRAAATLAYGSRTNSTVARPSGVVSGDVMVAVVTIELVGGTPAMTAAPDGWTLVHSAEPTDMSYSGATYRPHIYLRVAGGSEPSSYTWTHPAYSSSAAIVAYSGVDGTTPQDAAATEAYGSGTTATATGLTTVTAGAVAVMIRVSWDGGTATPPAGWDERVDSVVNWVGDTTIASPGATGNISVSAGNGGGFPWGAFLLALRPATSGEHHSAAATIGLSLTGAGSAAKRGSSSAPLGLGLSAGSGGEKAGATAAGLPVDLALTGTTAKTGRATATLLGLALDLTGQASKHGAAAAVLGLDLSVTALSGASEHHAASTTLGIVLGIGGGATKRAITAAPLGLALGLDGAGTKHAAAATDLTVMLAALATAAKRGRTAGDLDLLLTLAAAVGIVPPLPDRLTATAIPWARSATGPTGLTATPVPHTLTMEAR